MCHDIPLRNPRGFAAQIIRRHHTRYLPIPFEDLVSDLVSEFWLAEQVRKPGTEEEKISFFWKVGRNRIYKLSRFYAGLPEENIESELPEREKVLWSDAYFSEEMVDRLPAILRSIESILDFHSRRQGRLDVRRWMHCSALGLSQTETAESLGIKRETLRAQTQSMRLVLAHYYDDLVAVAHGRMEPDDVMLRVAPSRWRRYSNDDRKRPTKRCVRCGAESATYHHVVPRRHGGEDSISNLAILCINCHSDVENWYLRQDRSGLKPDDWRRIFREWLNQEKQNVSVQ